MTGIFSFNLSSKALCLLFIYFIGFNILEALFPSMIAKAVNPKLKGTATGIYSSMQFLGIFCGGSLAGLIYSYLGISGIFSLNAILCILYLTRFSRHVPMQL
ncbi:MAG: hypothetical protein EBY16_11040 [Gammaproteobacteria bacterium]|nr:hypothetical protein [Gammaproteobacteria bacterium]